MCLTFDLVVFVSFDEKLPHKIVLRNVVIHISFHVYRDMYHIMTQAYHFTPLGSAYRQEVCMM